MRLTPVFGKKRLAALVAVVLVAAGATGAFALTRPTASAATPSTTIAATVGTIRQTVSATGTIDPARRADLSFPVSGTVTSVAVSVGRKVSKGATLATVGSQDLQSSLDLAQASVAAAQEQVDTSPAGSAQLASAQAQLAAAQSKLALARTALSGATLTAPFDGTVASVSIAPGDVVGSGAGGPGGGSSGSGAGSGSSGTGSSAVLGSSSAGSGGQGAAAASASTGQVVLISTDAWTVDASVAAADLASVKKGLQAEITPTGSTDKVFGIVTTVGVMATSSSGAPATFPVSIAVTGNPPGLYAGGDATVAIIVKQLNGVLTVPTAALSTNGGHTVVKVQQGSQQVSRTVTVGTTYGPVSQILTGIKAGDEVVVTRARTGFGGGATGQRQGGLGGGGLGGGGGGGGLGGGRGFGGGAPGGPAGGGARGGG